MMRGYVNRYLELVVLIEIEDREGTFQSFEAILNTGFNGEIGAAFPDNPTLGFSR